MKNMPEVNAGIVAVSRDCFPIELSQIRRDEVVGECEKCKLPVTKITTIVENEYDVGKALEELAAHNVNALILFLGNFGPEGPLSMLAQKFDGPVMFVAAAEESKENLMEGRGDAFCGMLNASYNAGLRKIGPYIPAYPVGTAPEIAKMVADFIPIARIHIGIRRLKVFTFGPRPQDFLACNAPIKPLYDFGVEVMENSELDLLELFNKTEGDPAVAAVQKDMEKELGKGNEFPGILPKLAQYEVALEKFMEAHLGASEYAVFANKCWPAFQTSFGFVPCYVNSRFASRGIPIACETDIYGALSEYVLTCATEMPATILDINNTIPTDIIYESNDKVGDFMPHDLFMGFHCGNTASSCMVHPKMSYQRIMKRLMEPDGEPNITRGTFEGRIRPGAITMFRLQAGADTKVSSYIAEGEVLDIDTHSFGSIGVFAVKEMARFYRYVLIEHRFPHHAGIGFAHKGKVLFDAMKMMGVDDVFYNRPSGTLYRNENPFS